MSDLTIGQDVLVETPRLFDGEAFIASVDEETENLQGDGVYVSLRNRDTGAALALVGRDQVVSLTEVFDSIR